MAEPDAVHSKACSLSRKRAGLDYELDRCLIAAERLGVPASLGCANAAEYAARFAGFDRREARERLRVAEALEAFLDLHHTHRRADGGDHDPDALVPLCTAHHAAAQRGLPASTANPRVPRTDEPLGSRFAKKTDSGYPRAPPTAAASDPACLRARRCPGVAALPCPEARRLQNPAMSGARRHATLAQSAMMAYLRARKSQNLPILVPPSTPI